MSIFRRRGSGGQMAVAAPAPALPAPLDTHQVRELRGRLQSNLGRDVSVPGEGPGRKVIRIATNPYLVLGAATVGIGVAGVLTAGTAHIVLGAVGAAQLTANGGKAIDWWKGKKQGTVFLDADAVRYLLSFSSPDLQEKAVRAALAVLPPGDAVITRQHLIEATASPGHDQRVARAAGALRSPYGRAGLALLSAGLFLIAITVIPEYIQSPSLRVGAALSVIGGILIAMAMTEAFKGPLTELYTKYALPSGGRPGQS